MTVSACAELVERGDNDRFLAAMAAPPAARARLFPLYAFNLEIARAPWVSAEPTIGEMRLTFWREVIEEAAQGARARAHEVAAPLTQVIRETGLSADLLDAMVVARWTDIARAPFTDADALWAYLDATAGSLMWASVRALGGQNEASARAVGRAGGLANWLLAAPEISRRGWSALPEGTDGLVARARSELAAQRRRAGPATAALRTAWRAGPVLARAARDPAAVAEGRLGGSEFARRGGLLWRALTGRW